MIDHTQKTMQGISGGADKVVDGAATVLSTAVHSVTEGAGAIVDSVLQNGVRAITDIMGAIRGAEKTPEEVERRAQLKLAHLKASAQLKAAKQALNARLRAADLGRKAREAAAQAAALDE